MDRKATFNALKKQILLPFDQPAAGRMGFGVDGLDQALGGGLARGRAHLVTGSFLDGAVAGFLLAVLGRLLEGADPQAPLVCCGPPRGLAGQLYGPGLAQLGFDPARLVLVCEQHPLRGMAAAEEALACSGVGAVIADYGMLASRPDMWQKAARRLQLAAEQGGTTAFVTAVSASAAGFETGWHLAPAQLAGPGWQSGWSAQLLHARGGRPWSGLLSWQPHSHHFATAHAADTPSLARPGRKRPADRQAA
jgi:protein ImuA